MDLEDLRRGRDLAVIGAGMTGAACAWYAVQAGLSVVVLDRGPVAGGTTGAGEGNLLVSDKEPGPELDLALLSGKLWCELREADAGRLAAGYEYEAKGGLVVAQGPKQLAALEDFAGTQRAAGVEAESVSAHGLRELEPHLARDLAGGVYYPQDAQVQPARAAALLLREAVRRGAMLLTNTAVTGLIRKPGGRIGGVVTERGEIRASHVLNAAGTWGAAIAGFAGVHLPVLPRRGFVLVTEPLPRLVHHKVYTADYVANVASDSAGLEVSAVVEGTASGPVLIGASRERVGFDRGFSLPVARQLARQAVGLFPRLEQVKVLRSYVGFRPYLPDHLPAIGADPRAPGLLHACGHEGAGIGLAPATGYLISQVLAGEKPALDLTPFRPDRFEDAAESRPQPIAPIAPTAGPP